MQLVNAPLVVTQFSGLSHKELMQPLSSRTGVPSWVPAEDQMRLRAYLLRSAYVGNQGRDTLPADTPVEVRQRRREYGDAGLLVDRTVAGVIGSEGALVVDGADDRPLTEGPMIPAMPRKLDSVDDPEVQRLLDEVAVEWTVRWREGVAAALDRWRERVEQWPGLHAREAAVRSWAERRHFAIVQHEVERDAVALGDGVIVLWPQDWDWPALSSLDPGTYFPVLPSNGDVVEFPNKVHLAWEYEETGPDGTVRRFLRRLTFELVDLTEMRSGADDLGRPAWLDERGQPSLVPPSRPDERLDEAGRLRRRYPWDPVDLPVKEWSTRTCLISDGTWELSKSTLGGLADLSERAADWKEKEDGTVVYRLDMGIDFIPVVHVPNTPTGGNDFGTSVIDAVAQILDDLAEADTSTMAASRYIGQPTISVSGSSVGAEAIVAPGRIFGLKEGGRMDTLDLSSGIEKLMTLSEGLQDRLWRTGSVPDEILGRAESGDVAGITLALRFAPFAQLVGVLRMTRDPKYRLLLKFAQRMAQVQGALEPGPTPVARLRWGNFMPTDRNGIASMVGEAVRAHVMSTQTAVAYLVAGGFPIDDARAEVDRIVAEDTESANQLADALAGVPGSVDAVASRLGVQLPQVTAPDGPPIPLPRQP